jgi:tyrosyl-tRNA synthetase
MDGAEVYGLTTPLITKADGSKMGKSVNGAVWLHEDQLSHYDYWQFWRNVDDRDVGRFLRLFTDVPLDEIARLEALGGAEINGAKIVLANEATAMCRGEEAAREAAETARRTFEEGGAGTSLPTHSVDADSIGIVDALTLLGLAASKGEARRKLAEGAVKVDDAAIEEGATLTLTAESDIKVSLGKKRHALLRRA